MKKKFFQAVQADDYEAAVQLLQADPDLSEAFFDQGISAVLLARYFGRPQILKAILKVRRTPLNIFEASALGNADKVADLLKQRPDSVHEFSSDGFTPLHLASYFGNIRVVELLISNFAIVNQPSTDGSLLTSLNSAAANRDETSSLEICRLLLAEGANVNYRQKTGHTALHSAASNGALQLVDLLLENGADPNITDLAGRTPAYVAAEKGHGPVIALLRRGKSEDPS